MLLLHYERFMMKMGKVDVEFNTVEELCSHYGVGLNYASETRKSFLASGTLQRHSGSGRTSVDKEERIASIVTTVRDRRNATTRDIAAITNIPKSTVHRLMHDDGLKLVTKRFCPLLTAPQMESRLKFCRINRCNKWIKWVDLDEKLFLLNAGCIKERYHDGSPRRRVSVQSRHNPQKLMVLSAVARPDVEHNFSGLIGIWRVTKTYTAQRSSKNHKRGEEYDIDTTITADSYHEIITQSVIPQICRLMPWADQVHIQQDNAKPHVGKGNVARINQFGDLQHPIITLINQPPQSPELNVNDLGLFHSLSKRTQKTVSNSLDDLWYSVQQSYYHTPADTLATLWETKCNVINQIITDRGGSIVVKHST